MSPAAAPAEGAAGDAAQIGPEAIAVADNEVELLELREIDARIEHLRKHALGDREP